MTPFFLTENLLRLLSRDGAIIHKDLNQAISIGCFCYQS